MDHGRLGLTCLSLLSTRKTVSILALLGCLLTLTPCLWREHLPPWAFLVQCVVGAGLLHTSLLLPLVEKWPSHPVFPIPRLFVHTHTQVWGYLRLSFCLAPFCLPATPYIPASSRQQPLPTLALLRRRALGGDRLRYSFAAGREGGGGGSPPAGIFGSMHAGKEEEAGLDPE